MRAGAAAVLAALAACAGRAPVDGCEDDLSGVWHEVGARGRAYHFLPSRSGGYEVFAMFDSARPPGGGDKLASPIVYAPWVWDLERRPAGVSGTRTQRMTRDGKSCNAVTQVDLRGCADDRLTIEVQVISAMDFATCAATPGAAEPLALER